MKKKNVDMLEKEEKIEEITEKKDNKKPIIITACMAVALIVGLVVAYTKILNPKSIFVKSVNKGYAKLERKLDNYMVTNKNKKPFIISGDVKFSMDADKNLIDEETKKSFEEFAKLKLSERFGIDQKNNQMIMNLRYMYDKEDIFNMGAYFKDDKTYIELKNIYDKYIELSENSKLNFSDTNLNVDKDDLKYFFSKTKDAIINNMNSKDFKQSSEKIKNSKKTIKVTKITYGLSEKTSTELALKFQETILKDSKYIKILAKLTEEKESAVKSNLKESIKSLKEVVKEGKLDKKVNVKFGILVKGITKKYVGFIFETVDGAKLVYYENGKNKEIRLSKENQDLIRVSTKDTKTVITLVSEGQEFDITVEKSIKGKKTIYDWDLSVKGAALNGKIIIDKVKENKDGTGETKITVEASMMGLITFKVEGDLKAEYVDKLPMPDTTNSIKAENISESDWAKIEQRLNNNDALQSFGNAFIQQQ